MERTWWKEAVIYQIYPRSFKDTNGDGIGDLAGVIEKLDYLVDLGIDLIWMGPVYQSPNDDNGYDISDYYAIMEEFGDMATFDRLLKEVHRRGLRLLMDLVVNHTSDEHDWFQQSRASRDNPYRDFYFWRDQPTNWPAFFSGDTWEYDELTESYYLHLFSKKQPDLNWENEKVRNAIYEMMRFWLDKGIDGFRMDVIPFISKPTEFKDIDRSDFNEVVEKVYANGPRVHEFLQEMHQEVLRHYDVTTVGEAPGVPPHLANDYVGADRGELSMIFHFGHMTLDWGPGGRFDPKPWDLNEFKQAFNTWYEAVGERGWVSIFLDNHDFVRMVSRWGNDTTFRVESAKLLALLLLTQRGTPSIYQGSEIGMTNVAFEDISYYRDVETLNYWSTLSESERADPSIFKAIQEQGRDNVRTPMQWSAQPGGGFTEGQPWIALNPNHTEINVEQALADPDSIFHFYRRALKWRKAHPTMVYGEYEMIDNNHPQLFAYRRWDASERYLIYLNFSELPQETLPQFDAGQLEWIMGNYPQSDVPVLRPWEARLYREV